MISEKYPYVAPQELIDEVKMNVSVLKPKQEQHFKGIVNLFQLQLTDRYGNFIPDQIHEQNRNLNQRIIVTTPSQLNAAKHEWDPELEEFKDPRGIKTRGFYTPQGSILFLTHPRYYGHQHWKYEDQEVKEAWINGFGSEKEAKREYGGQFFGNALIHEIVHAYEDRDHIVGFSEGGVAYYQEELCKAGELINFTGSNSANETLGMVYRKFVEYYGDIMHGAFFGGNVEPEAKKFVHDQFASILRKYAEGNEASSI